MVGVLLVARYRVKIIDGNCLEASDRRLKALREVQGGALPGKSLVVYEPAYGVVRDVFPVRMVMPKNAPCWGWCWRQCTRVTSGYKIGTFVPVPFCARSIDGAPDSSPRQHAGLPFEAVTTLRSVGRIETGHVAEQRVQVRDAQGVCTCFGVSR